MARTILNFLSKNKFLIFLFLISFSVRVFRLNRLPLGVIHDELNYVMNAKSLYLTGEKIPLTASALLSWGEKDFDVVISELPSLLLAPWIGPKVLNQFNARIFYVVMGSFSVLLLYLISKRLLGEAVAKYSGLVMAFNPWSVHISRTALEVNFAVFFFLLSVYFLIKRKSNLFLSFTFFVAMFMSYLGAKLHFFPLIVTFSVFQVFPLKAEKKSRKKYIYFILASLAVVLVYGLTIKGQPAGERSHELLIFNQDWAASLVNDERRQAIPNKGLEVFSNKATVVGRRIADVYLEAFSTVSLFSRGETVSVYSTWEYGLFHYLDFFFILLGMSFLFAKNKKVFYLIAAVILLSPLVSAIDLVEHTYAIRAYPMFPFLALLSGAGFYYISSEVKFAKLILGICYLGLISYFLNLYFYRYPFYSAERWFFGERILSSYVDKLSQLKNIDKITVSTIENAKTVYEKYVFYNSLYNKKEDVIKVNDKLRNHDFSWGKTTFVQGCPESYLEEENSVFISQAPLDCQDAEPGKSRIVDLKDSGDVFIIDKDRLCQGKNLPRFYRPMDIEVFSIEELSTDRLCEEWIVRFQ